VSATVQSRARVETRHTRKMRYVLVALVAIAGCKSAAAPAPAPANKVATPDYQMTAADELGFLAVDADLVIGLDLVAVRRSQLWRAFEPQIDALMRQAEQAFGAGCSELMAKMERMTMALKVRSREDISGVFVMRGGDMNAVLDCSAKNASRSGKTATLDRGVLVLAKPDKPFGSASRAINASTLVGHLDQNPSHDSLAAVLATGVPLRSSKTFMSMYERREPGAALWGIANGNAPIFAGMASSGMRPRAIDGTLVVTDKLTLTFRMTMPGVAEAANVVSEVDKLKAMVTQYIERLDATNTGPVAQVEVVITEAQLRALVAMLGGLTGP
jgi:hypothetical protein